jgi:hypothetical protein
MSECNFLLLCLQFAIHAARVFLSVNLICLLSAIQVPGWPIRLARSHQDLKNGGNRRKMGQRLFTDAEGPVIVLAVHLCGTLSLHAAELFNAHRQSIALALKPCCLPIIRHANRNEVWSLGGHAIDAKV